MKISLIVVAGAMMLLGSALNGLAGDDSFSIARAKDIPGKRVSGACLPFAQNLYHRLSQAGGEAHLIVFNWRNASGDTGTHAFVVYRDKDNRFWAMDNLQATPIWLAGSNPQAWTEFFALRFEVAIAAHRSDPALVGQYADRSRLVARHAAQSTTLLAEN